MASVSALVPPEFATTWGTAPDDGTKIKASDVRQLAQIALTNDLYLLQNHNDEHTAPVENNVFPFTIATIANVPFANVPGLSIDITAVRSGDDLKITTFGLWELNAVDAGSGNNVWAQLRAQVVEDLGGAATTNVPPAGVTYITQSTQLSAQVDQIREMFSLTVRHRVTAAGDVRVRVQAGVTDISGGGRGARSESSALRGSTSPACAEARWRREGHGVVVAAAFSGKPHHFLIVVPACMSSRIAAGTASLAVVNRWSPPADLSIAARSAARHARATARNACDAS